MTDTLSNTTDTVQKPQARPLLARLIGVIFSPRDTFAAIVAAPRWFGMMALVLLVTAITTGGFMLTSTGQRAFLDMMEKQGSSDQAMAMFEKLAPYMAYITIGQVLIITPIVLLIIGGILFVVFSVAMGGQATFKQLFTVLVHSQAVGLVGGLVKLPLNFVTKSMSTSTNVGAFFPMLDDTSFLARLLGMVDIFVIWWVMVLAIGLGVLYRRKTGPIAVVFFILYALIAVGIAALQAARS